MDTSTNQQKEAWDILQKLQEELKKTTESVCFIIGPLLKDIRDRKLYQYMGEGGYENFRQFFNNPEIKVRASTGYLYIRIHEYYVQTLGLTQETLSKISLQRLMRLLPALKKLPNERAVETIEELADLTDYDYDAELKERGMEPNRPEIHRCKECQLYRIRYRIEQICHCGGNPQVILEEPIAK